MSSIIIGFFFSSPLVQISRFSSGFGNLRSASSTCVSVFLLSTDGLYADGYLVIVLDIACIELNNFDYDASFQPYGKRSAQNVKVLPNSS